MKRILIFAYYSYKDPVFQSAVLPYFQNFPNKDDYEFILLTFEQKRYRQNKKEILATRDFLKRNNITWYKVRWRSGRFKFVKKIADLIMGFSISIFLIIKHRISVVYSEGFPGAIISYYITKFTFTRHIVHTFEPHAEYMIEAGVWKKTSWEAKLINALEKKIAMKAEAIFTATEEYKNRLVNSGVSKHKILISPSCVDTELFKYSIEKRASIRKAQQVGETDCVITYIGKFGGMYMEEELFKIFKVFTQVESNQCKFRFWIFTGDEKQQIEKWIGKYHLEERVHLHSLSREEVPSHLSASDFGFVAVRQLPSKRFCSPIKDGEYWSVGLPIIIPEGVSDDYSLAQEHNLGVVLEDLSEKGIVEKANEVREMFIEGFISKHRERIRQFAIHNRSIKTYVDQLITTLNR